MTRHCKYHCAVCDAHFTSLAGFDAHRPSIAGCREAPKNGSAGKFPQWEAVPGVCDLTKGHIGQSVPCLIWRDTINDSDSSKNKLQALNGSGKVIPPLSSKDRSTVNPRTSTGIVAAQHHLAKTVRSNRVDNPCRVCGKNIEPTGKRGRPRTKHEECV